MIAVPVQAWRRDEGGESVDEPQGGERQVRAPIGTGLRQVVDQLVSAGCLQAVVVKLVVVFSKRPSKVAWVAMTDFLSGLTTPRRWASNSA